MERGLFDPEHEQFREMVRSFAGAEIEPFHDEWERAGIVDREVWLAAGKLGLLGTDVPEIYGGGGVRDFRYHVVLAEELARIGASGPGFGLHNSVVAPYLIELADASQQARWLPGFCSGETISAIAMTEPGAGSDLAGITTTATRDGDSYILNGAKTFITNGILSDLVIVVAKTAPELGVHGISLLVVERGMPGFTRGRKLDKIGLRGQDTSELFFDDVRVPVENLLGAENCGFEYLLARLPQERLAIAVYAVAACARMLDITVEYCRTRTAFGQTLGSFQNTRFTLSDVATRTRVTQSYVDACVVALNAGTLSEADAAMAKWWASELQTYVADRCLQLHGGYGYMQEYPIARHFLDARVQTIYGGTTEIMKEVVAWSLGLD